MLMFYFSGTGNSKYMAERFCLHMGAECHSIEETLDFDAMITGEEVIGFCHPVFFSRTPRIMREFAARHMDALKTKICAQLIWRTFATPYKQRTLKTLYGSWIHGQRQPVI